MRQLSWGRLSARSLELALYGVIAGIVESIGRSYSFAEQFGRQVLGWRRRWW